MRETIETWLRTPVTPADALPIAVMGALLLVAIVLARSTNRRVAETRAHAPNGKESLLTRVGLGALPRPAAILAFAFWITLGAVLAVSIVATILSLPGAFAVSNDDPADASARWALLTLTALTGALGAVIALPFTIIRTRQNERNTKATEDGLVTDRINAAVASLGADKDTSTLMRPVGYTLDGTRHTIMEVEGRDLVPPDGAEEIERGAWQPITRTVPNMEVRVGAILALGRIARENLGFHVQIMEILCAYVRENAPAEDAVAFEAPEFPEDATKEATEAYRKELNKALEDLKETRPKPRTDIKTALEVLGRRTEAQKRREGAWPDPDGDAPCIFDAPFPTAPAYADPDTASGNAIWQEQMGVFRNEVQRLRFTLQSTPTYRHDLRNTNLQGYDLSSHDLRGAWLNGAQMQGASLGGAKMQGASLGRAQMQGADLFEARMQGADLFEARMQGAVLYEVRRLDLWMIQQ